MFCGVVYEKNYYFKEYCLIDRYIDIGFEKNILGNSVWCLYYEVL